MVLYVNDATVLRTVRPIAINHAGTLRRVNKIFVNDAGILRQVYSAIEETLTSVNTNIPYTAFPQTNYSTFFNTTTSRLTSRLTFGSYTTSHNTFVNTSRATQRPTWVLTNSITFWYATHFVTSWGVLTSTYYLTSGNYNTNFNTFFSTQTSRSTNHITEVLTSSSVITSAGTVFYRHTFSGAIHRQTLVAHAEDFNSIFWDGGAWAEV